MSSSTTTTCLRSMTESAARSAFLASPGLLLDRDHRVPEGAAAERDVDVVDLDAGGPERLADRRIARRRGEPGVLPRHVQVVVDRVLAHRDRLDAHQRVPVQAAHQAGEFAEASFRIGPAGRQDFGFEDDLGVGDIRHIDGLAGRQFDRDAADAARDRHFVDAERRPVARTGDLDRVRADRDRDRQRLLALKGALGEQPHVVRRDDVDAGQILLFDDESVDARVDAELGVARDHHAGGDHRPAVVDRRHRDRQLVEVDVVAEHDHFAGRRGLDVFGRNRTVDPLLQLVLDLAKGLAAERHDRPLFRPDDAGDDRHVVADHVVEIERCLGLVDQSGDMPDVDRLVQVDQFADLPQPIEKLAEILLHTVPPKQISCRARPKVPQLSLSIAEHPEGWKRPSGRSAQRYAEKRTAGRMARPREWSGWASELPTRRPVALVFFAAGAVGVPALLGPTHLPARTGKPDRREPWRAGDDALLDPVLGFVRAGTRPAPGQR